MAQEPLNDVVNVDGLELSLPTESPATMGTEEGSTSEWSGSGPDVGSESRHDSFSPSDDTDVERGVCVHLSSCAREERDDFDNALKRKTPAFGTSLLMQARVVRGAAIAGKVVWEPSALSSGALRTVG
ncbi:hypothetical protein MTO96_035558 [Rhipicephalus appendiculatus]